MRPDTNMVVMTGKVYAIDSWDGERFTVEMTDEDGNVLNTITRQGNNFANMADATIQCEGTVGGWQDGVYDIRLESVYDPSMGDITVTLTNTLDQGPGDESIGWGEFSFNYFFDDGTAGFPTESPAFYDGSDVPNPSELWQNDCGATQKECSGFHYFGGLNECGQGNTIWREFDKRYMHPNTERVTLTGMIWTIDSWDGEQFVITMYDQNGNQLAHMQQTGSHGAQS
jgi:hypothetical protein